MRKILNLLRGRRARLENDLDRELRYHFDRRVEDLRAEGRREDDARKQAAIEMGGIEQVQEDVRETWTLSWLDDAARDARYAARSLARSPGFTITAVASLAIGIGASAAIFSLLDQVLLRLLPVREPERLVLVDWKGNALAHARGRGAGFNLMSYPICRDLQEQARFFDGVLCRHPTEVNLAVAAGQTPELVGTEIVSGSYFPVLGVSPALGRLLNEDDDGQPGAHPVVVLSHAYWLEAFGGAPDVVGRRVLVNNFPMTVVGVASATFRGIDIGDVPAVWIPAAMKKQATPEWDKLLDRRTRWMQVIGRLRPGVTGEQAQAGLQPWFKSMLDEDTRHEGFPLVTAKQRAEFLASTLVVTPAAHGHSLLRQDLGRPLQVLMAATLLLLLLASLNVASLFLARGAARGREIRTRLALGASRRRIASLLLADSVWIAGGGGALGLLVAPMVSRELLSFLPSGAAGTDLSSRVDGRVFAFAMLMTVATGVLCGVAPAWRAGRVPLISWLRDRTGAAGGGVRLRKALVVGQMAFTLVLLVGAGLFVQTLLRLVGQGPGFATAGRVAFRINPRRAGASDEDSSRTIRRVLAELRSLPDVESVGLAGVDLLSGGSWNDSMTIEADKRIVTDRAVHLEPISPGLFATLGTRVIAGRDFDERDALPPVGSRWRSVIVNERFARRYFGDASALGRRVGLGDREDVRTNIEIVGVVQDFSYRDLREQTEQAFVPYFEGDWTAGTFYLHVRGTPQAAFASIRSAVGRVDPTLPLLSPRTLDEQVDRSLTTERMMATLSGGFAAVALLLSVVGLYGVMAFVASSRTPEIGIRMALGATRRAAVWLVVADAVAMIAAGTAIALPPVWGLSRLVEAQLFGVHAIDAPTIAVASLLLAGVALAAAIVPAWRAASVSPTEALRFE
jgi:predicted permease